MKSKSPILISLNTSNQEEFTKRLEFARKNTDSIHIDLFDNQFAHGSTLAITNWPKLDIGYSEAHLMVQDPLEYLKKLAQAKLTRAIIHLESDFDLPELTETAKELDLLLGFTVNPDTDLEELKRIYPVSLYIQVMGVFPGRSGQFQQRTTPIAVSYLRKIPQHRLTISIDGGVYGGNIDSLKQAGGNYFVVDHAIFHSKSWPENLNRLMMKLGESRVPARKI